MYALPKKSGLGLYPKRDEGLGIAPVVAGIAAKAFGGISFKTPSEKRAAKVVPAVVAAANQGNLRAVAILDTRRVPNGMPGVNVGVAKERAVWQSGFARVSPSVLAVYGPQRSAIISAIPVSVQSGPEAAASWALQTPVTPDQTTIQKISDVVVPAFLDTQAGREVQSAVVQSAVSTKAGEVVQAAKSSALPLAIGAVVAFLLFRKK